MFQEHSGGETEILKEGLDENVKSRLASALFMSAIISEFQKSSSASLVWRHARGHVFVHTFRDVKGKLPVDFCAYVFSLKEVE
jgi:hypothetical protein